MIMDAHMAGRDVENHSLPLPFPDEVGVGASGFGVVVHDPLEKGVIASKASPVSDSELEVDTSAGIKYNGDGSGENLVVKHARVGLVPGWVTEWDRVGSSLYDTVREH
ncbi:hypothetical protein ACLOJK_013030 [Asimina triloba]